MEKRGNKTLNIKMIECIITKVTFLYVKNFLNKIRKNVPQSFIAAFLRNAIKMINRITPLNSQR